MNTIKDLLARARAKRPLLDHLVRMQQRYQADTGDRLASAVTYYWFLSLFPILLIAVYVTRQVLGDDAGQQITSNLGPYLGKDTAKAVAKVVQDNAGKAGILGLIGVLLSGLGWINGLREAIRTIWHQNVSAGNFITKKIADVVALFGLFAVIAGSVFVSTAATASTDSVIDFLGLKGTAGAGAATGVLSYVLGALIDLAIFLFLFVRLAKVATPLRSVLSGCVFGAIGFELLKFFGAFYISRTTSKGQATYGTFATVVGTLLFLNLVSRLILYSAAFVVTAPYDSDTRPSGTADAAEAVRAGIPEEYAGNDLNVEENGAPTPLGPALQGAPVQDAVMERSWSPKSETPPDVVAPASTPSSVPNEKQVKLAANAVVAASGAVILGVGLYAGKTVARVLRR